MPDKILITVEVEEDGTVNVFCSENATVRIVNFREITENHQSDQDDTIVNPEKYRWDMAEAQRDLARFTTGLIELTEEF